jgi:osmotically-inducible protein OsmY
LLILDGILCVMGRISSEKKNRACSAVWELKGVVLVLSMSLKA